MASNNLEYTLRLKDLFSKTMAGAANQVKGLDSKMSSLKTSMSSLGGMIAGTFAVQNSILFWASGHRTHHRHVDDVDQDPYSINNGFWYAHMGWMLRNYPAAEPNYKNAPDLLNDKLVMFQHKYYVPLVIAVHAGLLLPIGWLVGDVWGVLLLGGLIRLFISHHVTFFINFYPCQVNSGGRQILFPLLFDRKPA